MAISRFSTSSVAQGLPKYQKLWDGTSTLGSFESISSYTVPSGGASGVTFSSIPQSYKHLQIRVFGRSTASAAGESLTIGYNGDTTNSNYIFHRLFTTGGGANNLVGDSYANEREVVYLPAANASANFYGVAIIDMPDYTSTTKAKVARSLNGRDFNGSGQSTVQSSTWLTTNAAINSIALSANLAQYSTIALYGMKG